MEKNIKLDHFTSVIFILFLSFFIATSLLNVGLLPTVFKYLFIGIIILIFMMISKFHFISSNDVKIFFPFAMLIAIYFFRLESFSDFRGIMIILNLIMYLLVMQVIYKLTWHKKHISLFSKVFYISIPILLSLIYVIPDRLNTNTIGSYAFFLSYFPLVFLYGYSKSLSKIRVLLVIGVTIFIIFATDTRSILLSYAFLVFTFLVWRLISKSKILFNIYFLAIVFFNYFVVVVYPNLYKWEHFYKINDLSIAITGKPIMTGRNTIWAQLLDIVSVKKWFGYGSSVVPENFLTTSLSAHNLYLQTALQIGIIGIAILFLVFSKFWNILWANRYDIKVKISACFLISILVHQSFEVTLTQNQFGIGLLQWLIIAFGINFSIKKTDPM